MRVLRIAGAVATALAIATPLIAQDSTGCATCTGHDRPPSAFALRSAGAFSAIQSRPLGAMAHNIGFGYGVDGAYLFRLDHAGVFSLRAELALAQYGDESKRVRLSNSIGDRIQVDVVTNNDLAVASFGPQIARPNGTIRPYVNGGIGAQFFFTDSHVNGANDSFDFANTTNQHDWTPVWVAGGGVMVPLYERRVRVLLDAGVQYLNGGHARYLRPGSIQDFPDGHIEITPLESDTHMALVHLGVRIGL
ncbi:MAG TPA: hypothetical protein VHB25_18625 [Gemmatimonadaceae bacterium]|nr:hypothetical protein [Gemmatimonadaceae bacterium]